MKKINIHKLWSIHKKRWK